MRKGWLQIKKEENFLEENFNISFTWYQIIEIKVMRLIELFKVACHRPYMIKSILSTRCPHCGRLFSFPTISQQRTEYQDKYSNYFCGCKYCRKENASYWNDMWEDYYSSRL